MLLPKKSKNSFRQYPYFRPLPRLYSVKGDKGTGADIAEGGVPNLTSISSASPKANHREHLTPGKRLRRPIILLCRARARRYRLASKSRLSSSARLVWVGASNSSKDSAHSHTNYFLQHKEKFLWHKALIQL